MPLDLPNATLLGAAVHPSSGKVFAHFQTAEEHVVRCIDRAGKKQTWERTFPQPSPNGGGINPKVSPDGQVVVALWWRQFPAVQPGAVAQPGQPLPMVIAQTSRPQLLKAGTGDVIADLGGDDIQNSGVIDFSTDSKLMSGWQYPSSGRAMQLVIWETKSGKPLKTWNRGSGDVIAVFAPSRHELAIVERSQTQVVERLPKTVIFEPDGIPSISPPAQQPQVLRVEHTAIIGVWDLAPLVK